MAKSSNPLKFSREKAGASFWACCASIKRVLVFVCGGHAAWRGLGGQLPAAPSFPYLDVCTSTAQIFLSCSSHEFALKDYFLKTFYLLKWAVSIGCTCSQGYHPRVNP